MKTSQMNPSRLVLALLAAGAIGGAGATAAVSYTHLTLPTNREV